MSDKTTDGRIWFSESGQDKFAYSFANSEGYGNYLEIGAHGPWSMSNTHALEHHGWDGFSVEIDTDYLPQWQESWRDEQRIIWNDATKVNYSFVGHVTYLSCDIEPSEMTLAALKQAVICGVTFDCCTFEHGVYAEGVRSRKAEARSYMESLGYRLHTENVKSPAGKPFEDWYVR